MRIILSALVVMMLASTAQADGSADIDTDAICQKAKGTKLPQVDPTAKVAKDCDSQALYYGIGRAVDAVAARACALSHLNPAADAPEDPMEGPSTLATIYANGRGVPRDYDIAIAFACQMNAATAEMEGRLKHLETLKISGPGKDPFDICDDITSGLMEGACAERASEVGTIRRDAKLAVLTQSLDGAHKAAFAKLRQTEAAFVTALGDNEVDLSGTARTALVIGAQDGHHDDFATTLEAALSGKLAAKSPPELAKADKALNAAYAKVMALKDTSGLGTVEKSGIKTTQRAWIAYRDAFVAFAKGAPTSGAAIASALTEQRTKDLAAFLP